MEQKLSILAIVAIAALAATIVVNALPAAHAAIFQGSTQISGQGSSQTQVGISALSPQTSVQLSGQSSTQAACVAFNFICG